ncbi:hypothetical protein [Streptomyces sp. NBC_00322]|uniref:hypothetical protein n=1 Tax=Streptomyces sp. NBC_00322 TaxID=2975712 RepID=UPI003FA7288F
MIPICRRARSQPRSPRTPSPYSRRPGSPASRALRAELLDVLLGHEQDETRDLAVLDAVKRAVVVGPGARRMVETLGSQVPMRTDGRGHGSLRPA